GGDLQLSRKGSRSHRAGSFAHQRRIAEVEMALFGNILGGTAQRRSGMSTLDMALLGVLAYRTLKGKGRLAEMLGRSNAAAPAAAQAPGTAPPAQASEGGLGGLLGGLGGLGALGGLVGGQ